MADAKALLALLPIAASLGRGRVEVAKASMMGIDSETGATVLPERAFQWFPESFSDSIEIGWEPKQVPGSSHAIMQWGGNGGRTFSFETLLYRNMAPLDLQRQQQTVLAVEALPDPSDPSNLPYNINIESMISWMRAFCYPRYVTGEGFGGTKITRPVSPPIAILNLPGMALNEDGADIVYCVVTGCDVTYEKLFPNGQPKVVKVNLTLKQVVQYPGAEKSIQFVGFDTLANARKLKFDKEKNTYGAEPRGVALDRDVSAVLGALDKLKFL